MGINWAKLVFILMLPALKRMTRFFVFPVGTLDLVMWLPALLNFLKSMLWGPWMSTLPLNRCWYFNIMKRVIIKVTCSQLHRHQMSCDAHEDIKNKIAEKCCWPFKPGVYVAIVAKIHSFNVFCDLLRFFYLPRSPKTFKKWTASKRNSC